MLNNEWSITAYAFPGHEIIGRMGTVGDAVCSSKPRYRIVLTPD